MNSNRDENSRLQLGIVGSNDFCLRLSAAISAQKVKIETFRAVYAEAWAQVLSRRPNIIIVELGHHHSPQLHRWLRSFLANTRERLGDEIFISIALTAPEKLTFAGDLLFLTETGLAPARWIDTFIAGGPGAAMTAPSLGEQLSHTIHLYEGELQRRCHAGCPLPQLGAEGWVQSLADPMSRELWMRWLLRYASYTNENPIIIGETGTGKTNLAYALHQLSGRNGKFVSVTPRDFSSPELVQAELFGAVPGAYTGAVEKWGLVKSAEGGTLFIDELQSIDKDLQGKLITFIENKTYRRVGSAESIEANVRFVFAANKTLYEMIESDILRHDFAYRLERVQLNLLPLRARKLDISAALGYALAKVHRQRPHRIVVNGVNNVAYRMLYGYNWPGNLRQLENKVAQLCEIADMEGSNLIDETIVARVVEPRAAGGGHTATELMSQAAFRLAHQVMVERIPSIDDGVEKFCELVRISALEASSGDPVKAAELIGDHAGSMRLFADMQGIKKELVAVHEEFDT